MERRQRRESNKQRNISLKNKYIIYWLSILGIVAIMLMIYVINSKSSDEDAKQGDISNFIISDTDTTDDTESASSSIGNTVEQSIESESNGLINTNAEEDDSNQSSPKENISESNNTSNKASTNTATTESELNAENEAKEESGNTTSKETNTTNATESTNNEEETVKKEVTFVKPVEGSIIKEFAKDNLVYSETLKEWITHNGIDISANKTTVVKAAADGTVEAIKNDPRYGLTVIINHDDGFQTVYSNLLTAEFVVEGEELKAGQSIGTVGNSASFESSDDSHLHFEMLKNDEYVDPSIYIKY